MTPSPARAISPAAFGRDLFLALAAMLAIVSLTAPATASAITTREQVSTFTGSDSDAGAFTGLARIATHQASGSVYAIDASASVVDKFDASGVAQDFSALGSSSLDGNAVTAPDGPVAFNLTVESDVAVDNSETASDGNLVVLAESQQTAWVFDSTGAYQHQITGFGDPCGVAVDAEGHVWIADYSSVISEYDASGVATGRSVDTTSVGPPCHFAIDSSGNLYVATYNGPLHKFDSSGAYLGQVDSEVTRSVAVDRTSGRVYVVHADRVSVYDADGAKLYDFADAIPGASLTGVAINEARDEVYVSDAASNTVRVFGPAFLAPPVISSPSAVGVTATEATIRARVNPRGEATTYHFEYGTTDAYGTDVPTSDVSVGSGTDPVTASRLVAGLHPGTTYHWRIVATNVNGTVASADRTFTTADLPAASTNCANQQFRTGPSAKLPDCRAYEMVSPVDKNNGDIKTLGQSTNFRTGLEQASADGGKITYSSYKAFGDAVSSPWSSQYIASRGDDGWNSHAINAPRDTSIFGAALAEWDYESHFKAFTDDLSTAWAFNDNATPLTPDAVEGHVNLYKRDNADDSYKALTTAAPSPANNYIRFQGHSSDGSHAVFAAASARTPDAVASGEWQLYDYSQGQTRLASVMPDGTPSTGSAWAGGNDFDPNGAESYRAAALDHAVSDDGSRIFWTRHDGISQEGPGDLYVRIDGTRTEQISTSGDAFFRAASADGSKVIFDTAQYGQPDQQYGRLYEFDVDAGSQRLIAENVRGVLGASDDLSYIYFASKDDLAAGATQGKDNLYLEHDGVTKFIVVLAPEDVGFGPGGLASPNVVSRLPIYRPSRVTPDGRHIAFESIRTLTGYDNTDAVNGEADIEVFTYDASDGELTCASCNPSGASPVGQALRYAYTANDELRDPEVTAAAWLTTSPSPYQLPRALSADGNRLFFNSFDALTVGDTNGEQDVYQWEAQGSGSCEKSGGCVSLISSGTSRNKSEFVDAAPTGDDVFFTTASSLVAQDPALIDIYDARVGGGFAPRPAPAAECEGDSCQGRSSPPANESPSSSALGGSGNKQNGRADGARVRVVGRHVGATKFSLRVKVTGKGVITATGAGVKGVRRRVTKAGTYRLSLRLTAKGRRKLAGKARPKVTIRVRFAPAVGKASQSKVVLRLKQSKARRTRAAKNNRRGAK